MKDARAYLWLALLLAACTHPSGAQPLTNLTFVAFDVETTGFSTNGNHIVELGAARIRGGRIETTTNWLVHPGIPIPYMASSVHGITDETVDGSPGFEEVLPAFKQFAGDAVLLAHNAHFDVRFIRADTARCGLAPPANAVLNTLALARALYPDAPAHNLGALAEHMNISISRSHRADTDSIMVAGLFLKALQSPDVPHTLQALAELCGGALSF